MARKVTIGVELAPSTDKLKAAFADVSREIQRQQQLLDAEPQAFGAALSYLLGFRKKPAATGTAATTTTPAAG